ncbi:MAG: UDP-N-acetylmuramoyl-L-alanyl-D-glutamate--2,6-diaminopimelate ligase [Bacilli bacterium]
MINIKSDSRKVTKGDIFIALRGISSDGHDYIKQAINSGASKIIAEFGEYSIDTKIVPDTRAYLEKYLLDNYKSCLSKMTIIGITGTNGKSTAAFFCYQALNNLNIKCAYIGTIGFYLDKKICSLPNTSCEITETYDMITTAYDQGYRHIILEVSSQGLSYRRIETLTFDYVVFTNLTQDHLDYHKTMGNYALAKQRLFYKLKPAGHAIVNYDDQYKDYFLLEKNHNITYGFNGGDYHIVNYETNKDHLKFTYEYQQKSHHITVPIIGKYNIYNLIIVIIIMDQLNLKEKYIKKSLKNLSTPPGRLDLVPYNNNSIIIDYAHTTDAFSNIITTVKEITLGNIYVVYGCTGDRDRLKRPIMTKLVTDLCKSVIITIDDPHNENPQNIVNDMIEGLENNNYEICLDRKQAIIKGINLLQTNDVLLILGKGHEETIIYGNKIIPFNDKKIVIEYLDTINK